MLTVSTNLLMTWVTMLIWPLTRILAFIAVAPVLNHRSTPRRVKVILGIMVTLVIIPIMPAPPAIDIVSMQGVLLLSQQILIGVAMGLSLQIIFAALEMAGVLASMSMGLGFAVFFDPNTNTQSPAVGQILILLASLILLSMNGHLMMIEGVVQSFQSFPITNQVGDFHLNGMQVASWGAKIFSSGLLLSLPVVATLLVTNLALGILTRTAPQLNLFGIGFPVTIGVGFLVLSLALPNMLQPIQMLINSSLMQMNNVLIPSVPPS